MYIYVCVYIYVYDKRQRVIEKTNKQKIIIMGVGEGGDEEAIISRARSSRMIERRGKK